MHALRHPFLSLAAITLDVPDTTLAKMAGHANPAIHDAALRARHVDREAARRALPAAVAYRLADPNVTDAERARVRRLAAGSPARGRGFLRS
jgi:hypothetical protein